MSVLQTWSKDVARGLDHPESIAVRIERRAKIARQILRDLDAAGPLRMPVSSFLDDEIYVYDADTKRLKRSISCKSQEAIDTPYVGLRVQPGETWARGLSAKYLGLWEAS